MEMIKIANKEEKEMCHGMKSGLQPRVPESGGRAGGPPRVRHGQLWGICAESGWRLGHRWGN